VSHTLGKAARQKAYLDEALMMMMIIIIIIIIIIIKLSVALQKGNAVSFQNTFTAG